MDVASFDEEVVDDDDLFYRSAKLTCLSAGSSTHGADRGDEDVVASQEGHESRAARYESQSACSPVRSTSLVLEELTQEFPRDDGQRYNAAEQLPTDDGEEFGEQAGHIST